MFLVFLMEQGGGRRENLSFSLLGVKFCLREGDCALTGQPMGIPPLPICGRKSSKPLSRLLTQLMFNQK